ncbi:MAG: sterol desaturase family protein [Aridibacter sp.]
MKWLSGLITVGTFTILYYFENKKPLRKEIEPGLTNTFRNLAIASVSGLVVNNLEKPVTDKLTKFTEENRFGLVKYLNLPKFIEDALAVILLDYTLYIWHYLTHKSDFLWNYHKIHHADLDLKTSTAIRFHFVEMSLSIPWRAGQIVLIGVSPRALKIWQTALFMSVFFHHSNLKLPEGFEKRLQKIITTPRLHGIHHSEIEDEMNSNWSSGLAFWDFIHGTFRDDIPQEQIKIGVVGFENKEDVRLINMLLEPLIEEKSVNKLQISN